MTIYAIDQETQIISQDLGIPGFTPHDLKDLKPHLETAFGADFYRRYKDALCLPELSARSPL